MPLNLLTLQSIVKGVKVLIDFLIVWVLIYYILKVVRNNSRTVQIFKGVVLVILVRFLAYYFGLTTVRSLADFVIQYGMLVFVIIFQPEIRGILERIGKSSVFSSLHSLTGNERERLVNELVNSAVTLSKRKIGGLITSEQGHSLVDYIKTGTPINASVTEELLTSIFVTTTPLHDGAVIIQGDRVACASAYFPPTSKDLPTRFGARHRAAMGISEITDSITIVVSEETGTISIAEGGKFTEVDEFSLREYLNSVIRNTEKEVSERIDTRVSRRVNFGRFNIDPIRVEKVDLDDVDANDTPKKIPDSEKLKEGFLSIFKKRRELKKDHRDTVKKSETAIFKKDRDDSEKPSDGEKNKVDIDALKSVTKRSADKADAEEPVDYEKTQDDADVEATEKSVEETLKEPIGHEETHDSNDGGESDER